MIRHPLLPVMLLLALGTVPAAGQGVLDVERQDDHGTIYRDRETGCGYVAIKGVGVAARLRRDGQPDCPAVRSSPSDPPAYPGQDRELQQLTSRLRDVADGLRNVQRELERRR